MRPEGALFKNVLSRFGFLLQVKLQPDWIVSVSMTPHPPGSPRSLGHLCRLQMRRSLTLKRLNNPKIMNSHIIPPRLKKFLLYQELDSSTGP